MLEQGPNQIDCYRRGTGSGFGLDVPNGFCISSGDALSINLDSPANLNGSQNILSISVLDKKLAPLNSVEEG